MIPFPDALPVFAFRFLEVLPIAATAFRVPPLDGWPKLPTEDKRKIAESIIEKIVIGDREIDLNFSCLPSSEELTKSQQRLRGPG